MKSVQIAEPSSGYDINARRIQWCGKYSYICNYSMTKNVEQL